MGAADRTDKRSLEPYVADVSYGICGRDGADSQVYD